MVTKKTKLEILEQTHVGLPALCKTKWTSGSLITFFFFKKVNT